MSSVRSLPGSVVSDTTGSSAVSGGESRVLRLGAVGYLNARPHVFGLARSRRFDVRFDVPSRCADLLHEGAVDLGLIPSIEYLRGADRYCIVPDVAIASRGPVASVALFTRKPVSDIRTLALDTSSRTSVALIRVLCRRAFDIDPTLEPSGPDLESMLAKCDAALLIGDSALLIDSRPEALEKIDLGETWTRMTGLPFVYAFWAGRPGVLGPDDVRELQRARDEGVANANEIASDYFEQPAQRTIGAKYLQSNIKYHLGPDERAGLELFYQYAAEAGLVGQKQELRFYEDE